jgi:hypothetical protein
VLLLKFLTALHQNSTVEDLPIQITTLHLLLTITIPLLRRDTILNLITLLLEEEDSLNLNIMDTDKEVTILNNIREEITTILLLLLKMITTQEDSETFLLHSSLMVINNNNMDLKEEVDIQVKDINNNRNLDMVEEIKEVIKAMEEEEEGTKVVITTRRRFLLVLVFLSLLCVAGGNVFELLSILPEFCLFVLWKFRRR